MIPRKLSDAATAVIHNVYTVAEAPADPHLALTDLARSITIVGHLLEGLSDRYQSLGKRYASWIAIAGTVLWNLVEVSVPHSLRQYLFRYWIKLGALLSVLILILGAVAGVGSMVTIGLLMLVAVFLFALISNQLRYFMNTGKLRERYIRKVVAATVLVVVLGGTAYLAISHGTQIAAALHHMERVFLWMADLKVRVPRWFAAVLTRLWHAMGM